MNWTWIENPLALYAALAAGLIACLLAFYNAKKEMIRLRREWAEERTLLTERLGQFQVLLEKLNTEGRESEPKSGGPPAVWEPALFPAGSIQQSKRNQALRMYRRGEPAEKIAATLQMPRSEVTLMLKVQKAVAGS